VASSIIFSIRPASFYFFLNFFIALFSDFPASEVGCWADHLWCFLGACQPRGPRIGFSVSFCQFSYEVEELPDLGGCPLLLQL
jgi:hypothetical protein